MPLKELTYTYSLNKAFILKDKDHNDYLGSFIPFIIGYLKKNNGPKDKLQIRDGIESEFKFILPLHVISALLDRLVKDEYLSKTEDSYKLTSIGSEYEYNFGSPVKIEKDIDLFIQDLTNYLKKKSNEQIKKEDTCKLVRGFIYISFHKTFTPEELEKTFGLKYHENIKRFNYISTYIDLIKKKKPKLYETFSNLVKGYVVYLSIGSFPERNMRFKNITIYLDTNIIFSILNFHVEEIVEPEQELFKMMKIFKPDIAVLDFTIDEAKNYLNNCINKRDKKASRLEKETSEKLRIDSICDFFKKYFIKSEQLDVVRNLEKRIRDKGIRIEKTGIDIKNYEPKDVSIENDIKLFKPIEQPPASRNHDIAAIEFIKTLRNFKNVQRIEDSKAIFLTNDRWLSKYSYEFGHTDGTIPEVFLDRALTNLLWLSNPSIKIKINKMIASCCRGIFINPAIYDKFVEIVKSMKKDGVFTDKDLATLLYNNYLEEMLAGFTQKDLGKINQEFIKENISISENRIKSNINKVFCDFFYALRIFIIIIFSIHLIIILLMYIHNFISLNFTAVLVGLFLLILTLTSGFGPFKTIWERLIRKTIDYFNLEY